MNSRQRALSVFILVQFAAAATALGDPVEIVVMGQRDGWIDVLAATASDSFIYTVERDGRLYRTHPLNGAVEAIGGADFGATEFILAANDALYAIEADGSLYRVDPHDGSWVRTGRSAGWAGTIAATTLTRRARGHDSMATVQADGALYETMIDGTRRQAGAREFAATRFMLAANHELFTIESSGSLYKVDLMSGRWQPVGSPGLWKDTLAAAALNESIYTIEKPGVLIRTDASGERTPIGKRVFASTTHLFAAYGGLYTINDDGSLWYVELGWGPVPPGILGMHDPRRNASPGPTKPIFFLDPLPAGRTLVTVTWHNEQGLQMERDAEGTQEEIARQIEQWSDLNDEQRDASQDFMKDIFPLLSRTIRGAAERSGGNDTTAVGD